MAFSLRNLFALAIALPFVFSAPTNSKSLKIRDLNAAADIIPGKYIVVFTPTADVSSIAAHRASISSLTKRDGEPVQVEHEYDLDGFKGYSVAADEASIEAIAASPDVEYVEPDQVMSVSAITSQSGATWGLGRISNKAKGSTTYRYDTTAGQGTYVYVVDTGIYTAHSQFGGRATFGTSFISGQTGDGYGHGTHCAGTIGGSTYGVSKLTNLIAVKVLDDTGYGTNSVVLSGIQWSVNDATSKGLTSKSIISMSLGGGFSTATNNAVKAAYNAGITVVVAAGNDNANAANYSPASEPTAITVAASDSNDARSIWTSPYASNYGTLVDLFAPGTDVVSAGITSTTSTSTKSGTSMACPHVAGLAAYLISLEGISGPAAVTARIKALAQTSLLTGVNGSPNLLAYNGNGA